MHPDLAALLDPAIDWEARDSDPVARAAVAAAQALLDALGPGWPPDAILACRDGSVDLYYDSPDAEDHLVVECGRDGHYAYLLATADPHEAAHDPDRRGCLPNRWCGAGLLCTEQHRVPLARLARVIRRHTPRYVTLEFALDPAVRLPWAVFRAPDGSTQWVRLGT